MHKLLTVRSKKGVCVALAKEIKMTRIERRQVVFDSPLDGLLSIKALRQQ